MKGAAKILRIFARVPLASFKVPSQDSTATVLMSESRDVPRQHKAKTEGNENHSEENSTEGLAHFLPTKPQSGTAVTRSKSLLLRKCPRKQYPAAAGQQILAAVELVGDRRTLNVRA
jgi:hypothetical protein